MHLDILTAGSAVKDKTLSKTREPRHLEGLKLCINCCSYMYETKLNGYRHAVDPLILGWFVQTQMFVDNDADDETIGAMMVVRRVVTCKEEAIQGMIGVCFARPTFSGTTVTQHLSTTTS